MRHRSTGERSSNTDCDFSRAWMAETVLVQSTVASTIFHEARIGGTQIDHTRFSACDFREADLRQGTFYGSQFEDCDFRGARFDDRGLKDTTFSRCRFEGATGAPKLQGPVAMQDPEGLPRWLRTT